MKQREKINLVLRKLYDLRDDPYSHTLASIMQELGIFENDTDMRRLADRLEADQLAKITRMSGGVDAEISTYGIDYYEENLSGAMKQSEKTEAILQWLYERRNKGVFTKKLEEIMKELNVYESREEAERIVEDLLSRNLVTLFPIEDGAAIVTGITSKGVDYCEGGSSGQPGQSVNFNFLGGFHANNAVVGSNISHVRQTAAVTNEAMELVSKIIEGINSTTKLNKEEKADLLECIADIKDKIEAGKTVPKLQWGTLVSSWIYRSIPGQSYR